PLDPFAAGPTTTSPSSPDMTLPRTGKGQSDDFAVVSWWLLLAGLGVIVSFRRRRA
ncbi:MAG: LPXTG cell wall anchor domain-containing protein, partial [Actinobacteria bacterium]|nr:LPXTG cell wall anchor domain-containing protein [Actinomycetota bacterium]